MTGKIDLSKGSSSKDTPNSIKVTGTWFDYLMLFKVEFDELL